MAKEFFLGIDVGTGSVRAGIFDKTGKLIASATHPIQMWRPEPDFVEQSSEDIWESCCKTVKKVIQEAAVTSNQIIGVGFDATCSLVVLGENDKPLSVSPGGSDFQNIIVWMDHRAKKEAREINQTGHEVLKYVGGVISPEMQTPKLLWMKGHHPETWDKASKFFDLSDFLVYKATGFDVRSMCTTTCKWTYLCHEDSTSGGSLGKWDYSYFQEIGLVDLMENGCSKIGQIIRPVGEAVGHGLTGESARDMGLQPGTSVGVAIIDAHAGGLGLLGMDSGDLKEEVNFDNRIALIGGTSSCHMAVSQKPAFIDGVWGPYYSAMIPNLWLNEGGQSATGALIDHIILSSSHAAGLQEKANHENKSIYVILNERLLQITENQNLACVGLLTKDLHVLPYFHGNRSPRANPSLVGSICGLKLSSTLDDLALLYLAVIQAIAYGTRHIIETLNEKGYSINQIMATGGGTKNEFFLQQHADISGCDITLPGESEAVLLGSAILGAVAAGTYPSVLSAMQHMNQSGRKIQPVRGNVNAYHDAKYKVFQKMYRDEVSYFDMMEEFRC